MTNARQRRGTWPDGAPLTAYLPWWLTHGTDIAAASARAAFARKQERVRRDLRWRKRRLLERLGLRERPAPKQAPAAAIEPPAGAVDVGELTPGIGARLHAEGVDQIYVFGAEPVEELARYYWLRRLWVDSGGRKPDPLTGPVPEDGPRHLVGRRRLLPG